MTATRQRAPRTFDVPKRSLFEMRDQIVKDFSSIRAISKTEAETILVKLQGIVRAPQRLNGSNVG